MDEPKDYRTGKKWENIGGGSGEEQRGKFAAACVQDAEHTATKLVNAIDRQSKVTIWLNVVIATATVAGVLVAIFK